MIEPREHASGWKKTWQKQQWQEPCTEMQIWRASNKAGHKEFNKQEWLPARQAVEDSYTAREGTSE